MGDMADHIERFCDSADFKQNYRRETKMATAQETVTVDQVTQYGFKFNGKNYGISTRLAQQGITPQHFQLGARYIADVWTGPQGGKKINSFVPANGAPVAAAPAPMPIAPPPPMPPAYIPAQSAPALPQTTVAATPAPGGMAPVQPIAPPASSAPTASEGALRPKNLSDYQKPWLPDEIKRNDTRAIIESTIESQALAQLVIGKRLDEVIQTTREYVKANLETYQMALEGRL